MIKLETFLGALPAIGQAAMAIPAVISLFKSVADSFKSPEDQKLAHEAIDDLMADNDAGYARLDAKLDAAKKR